MGLTDLNPIDRNTLATLLPGLAIVAAAGLLALGGDPIREALRFGRQAIIDGQYWRLVTGHFVHLGVSHFILNAAGVLLVALLVYREFRPAQWLIVTLGVVASIGAGLLVFNPDLEWYVGLSGLIHGWLAAGTVSLLARRRPEAWPLAALLCAKLALEQWQGPLPGSAEATGGPVVVDAHLYGSIAGILIGLPMTRLGRRTGL